VILAVFEYSLFRGKGVLPVHQCRWLMVLQVDSPGGFLLICLGQTVGQSINDLW